ncbi:Calcium-channel protein CCH1 [Spathaspora sp. JA1]|nr:Calcium-channel protein CCH1 [Spathaspora sp. JA1]
MSDYPSYSLRNDVLYFGDRIVVPTDSIQALLDDFHGSEFAGHPGIHKMYYRLKRYFWFPEMRKTIQKYVHSCQTCARAKPLNQKLGKLQLPPLPSGRWRSVALDVVSGFPDCFTGAQQIVNAVLVLVDRFSSRVHLYAIHTTADTQEIINIFKQCYFPLHGVPELIVTDRGSIFSSSSFTKFLNKFNIEQFKSVTAHHQSNGKAERYIRSFEEYLRLYIGPSVNWYSMLPTAEFCINSQPSLALGGMSPFEVDLGYNPHSPVSLFYNLSEIDSVRDETDIAEELERLGNAALVALEESRKNYKIKFDLHRKDLEIHPGDQVYINLKYLQNIPDVHNKDLPPSLRGKFIGPYEVAQQISPVNYELVLPPSSKRTDPVFHISQLRLQRSMPEALFRAPSAPAQQFKRYSNNAVEVEIVDILNHKKAGRGYSLEVQYIDGDTEWHKLAALKRTAPELLSRPKKGFKPGIIIHQPSTEQLEQPDLQQELEDFHFNDSIYPSSSINPTHNTSDIPLLHQDRRDRQSYKHDRKTDPFSDVPLLSNNSYNIDDIVTKSDSSTPKPPIIDYDIQQNDDDIEELKQGLDYALGTEENYPNWFPVSVPYKQTDNQEVPSPQEPESDLTFNIPMQTLRKRHSIKSGHTAPSLIFENSNDVSHLESQAEETPTVPAMKFSNVISRISDRIAGTGTQEDKEHDGKSPLPSPIIPNSPKAFALPETHQDYERLTVPSTHDLSLHPTKSDIEITTSPIAPPQLHIRNKPTTHTMYLFGKSCKIFPPESKFRQFCYQIFENKYANSFLLFLLVLQIGLLSYRQWNPYKLAGYVYSGYNWADYVLMLINLLYTFEIAAKVIAYGFIDDKVMYQELTLTYPENEYKNIYFGFHYILTSVKWVKSIFKKKSYKQGISRTPDYSSSEEMQDIKSKYRITSHHRTDSISSLTEETPPTTTLRKNTFFKPKSELTDRFHLKRAFLRNTWHRIDFISMITFWISLLLSINSYDIQHQIMIFRAISCLRILRLLNLTTGTNTILKACKVAIPQLIDVSIFISFFWVFWAIIGVQSFKSSLSRRCVWTDPTDPNNTYLNTEHFCGSYLAVNGTRMPYIYRDGTPSTEIKGFTCPKYSQCISGENPYNGTVNFDNVFQSMEMVFIIISANTFTDIMYYTMESDNIAASLFFIGCMFIMCVWLVNVFIAVIVKSFAVTRMEHEQEQRGRRFLDLFGSSESHETRIEFLKNQNVLLKYYYKFEFVFVLVIIADLWVQCFRKHEMTEQRRHLLYRFEAGFTAVFLAEIIFRLVIHFPNWRLFFKSRRNCFDLFLAIVTSVIIIEPVKSRLGQAYYWLTVFQLMRFYRVVLLTSITRTLWLKIMGNIKAIFDLTLFFFILLFLVSIILARFFEGITPMDEVDDIEFTLHTLPATFISLYIITSTENWTGILYMAQEYAPSTSSRCLGAILLIAWFILSNMIIFNIFIAVIADTLEVSEEGRRRQQLLQFIENMTNKIQNINHEIGLLTKIKTKLFKRNKNYNDLEHEVVNLLLSGNAVNDFLDKDSYEQEVSEGWRKYFSVSYYKTKLNNPFYDDITTDTQLDNFNPREFAKEILQQRKTLIQRQNEYLKLNPKYNYVFYIIGPRHRFRRLCQRLVKPSYGERIDGVAPYTRVSEIFVLIMFLATMGLVVSACYMTPIFRRSQVLLYGNINWTFWLEFGFTILFTIEFMIKVIADGLVFTPNAYARSSWNLIDCAVLISLWIEVIAFLNNDGNLSRIVRGLKALRALRLLTISETATLNFHNTIISGFWKIINAAIISLCLLFPFSIWGLNIFNGRLGVCTDGESSREFCLGEYRNEVFDWELTSPNVYANPQLHFNRFANSFSTLFEIISLEGWTELLYNLMGSTGVGTPPSKDASPFNGFFIVLFNIMSTVFILTLFVSVIISNYSRTTGRAYMTTDQIAWYQVKKVLVQTRPSKRRNLNQLSLFRRFCYRMTVEKSPTWTRIINTVFFFHVLSLLLECWPSQDALNYFRESMYMITSTMFLINSSMIVIAQGRSFVQYRWNIANFIISLGAFITTIIGFFVDSSSTFINFNKLFLVGVLIFLIPRSNRLNQLLRFAAASLPQIISLSFTWIVIFLVFAIAMNQIFGLTKIGPNSSGNINFRTVPKSLILLFRCSFGEGWNSIMDDFTLEKPYCTSEPNFDNNDCGNKQYAYILFMTWIIISMYIFVNLFISLILDSFSYINHRSSYNQLIQREEIRKFKRIWQNFDPEGTGFIHPFELPKLMKSLDGALSFHLYSGELSIPALCKQWITRNSLDPYDVTVNFDLIDSTMNSMDIDKIRTRRRLYEMFIEEANVSMELNNEPGISFTRLLLQLPLYNSFDTGQCLNLTDYLERRLLLQKVLKKLHTKRVYELISGYACRWKYQKNKKLGIRDTDIAFDKQRFSYLSNNDRINTPPSIYVDDASEYNVQVRSSVIYSEYEGRRKPKLSIQPGYDDKETTPFLVDE